MNDCPVRLKSNGQYWQACWMDSTGHHKAKSLGPKSRLSKRAASALCNRLAIEMAISPGRRNADKAPLLRQHLKRYVDSRHDLAKTTLKEHKRTIELLLQFFSSDLRIDRITRSAARDWRTWIYSIEGISSEATVCKHVRNAKVMFHQAVDDDLVLANPFGRLRGTPPDPDKDWQYVSRDEFGRLLTASPNIHWRLLLALCRLGGLRRGEALTARWEDVDWGRRRLTVINPQGYRSSKKASRVIPTEPQLHDVLVEGYDLAKSGATLIAPVSHNNLRREFHRLIRRAGLEPWDDCFQVLRRNCDTDWSAEYPPAIVASWMGHSPSVSQRYYLQVPDELFEKVAQSRHKTAQNGTKSGTKPSSAETRFS